MSNSIKQDVFFYPYFMVSSAVWQDLLNLNLCESFENVGLYIIFIGLLWWLFILLGGPWGRSSQAVSSPWVFLVLGCWLVLRVWMDIFSCAVVLQCAQTIFGWCPEKKGFLPLPPPQEGLPFVISSWGHVSEFGFDMFVRCYERMWVSYYVGDLLRFSVGIRFQFPNPIGRSLNSDRRSRTFLIFSSIHRRTNEVSFVSSCGGSTRTV